MHLQQRQEINEMGTFWGSDCCNKGFHFIDEQTPGHAAGGLEDSARHMHKGIVLQSRAYRVSSQSQKSTSYVSAGLPETSNHKGFTSWQHKTQDRCLWMAYHTRYGREGKRTAGLRLFQNQKLPSPCTKSFHVTGAHLSVAGQIPQ